MPIRNDDAHGGADPALLRGPLGLDELLGEFRHLQALDRLVPALYGDDPHRRAAAQALRDEVLADLRVYMTRSVRPPRRRMRFGTSGWRGLLGEDFTVPNVMRVTQGLCDVLLGAPPGGPTGPILAALGAADADEVRRRGCVVAHDTRFMGPEMAMAAARVLIGNGVPVTYLGTATTPEVSAALGELGAAFSLNLTPSHNPYGYHGYKFNPADGGPATAELTAPIAARANEILDGAEPFCAIAEDELDDAGQPGGLLRRADPIALYRRALARRLPILDLGRLAEGINRRGLDLYIDNGFGATMGKYEALLQGVDPARLHVLNSAPDYLFGGQSREPSPESFRVLQGRMAPGENLCLGVINDGDGDRFMGGGRTAILPMNRFGPLCVRYLSGRHGLRGDVTRSLMTSHMADAALARYLPGGALHETRVGFQHLKRWVDVSVCAWEESDGMSPMGWSRDKDGLVAALLLISMVLDEDVPPEVLDQRLTDELGAFLFDRRKHTGRRHGEVLSEAIRAGFADLSPGRRLVLAEAAGLPGAPDPGAAPGLPESPELPDLPDLIVERVDHSDGVKVVFQGGWWLGVRASGTEPAARVYVETCAPPGAPPAVAGAAAAGLEALHALCAARLDALLG